MNEPRADDRLHAEGLPAEDALPPYSPDDHLRDLGLEVGETPWYLSLIQGIRDAFFAPQLPPLKLTSKPVAVKDIWGLYGYKKGAGAMSFAVHVATVVVLFSLAASPKVQLAVKHTVTSLVAPDIAAYEPTPIATKKTGAGGGGGGGGDRSPLPASKGRLPRIATRQFTPPMAVVNNPNPKLIMEPTLIIQPDVRLPNVNMAQYGDPLGKIGPPSNGPGSGGGIGSGSGGGVGSGRGAGYGPGEGGGFGGGPYRIGNGVSAPTLVYRVDPEYSEEARKAKYQGTVILYIEVNERGLPQNPRVIQAMGLGLDEKAIEAVMKWRFRPGYLNGKPVTVSAQVDVNFRLL